MYDYHEPDAVEEETRRKQLSKTAIFTIELVLILVLLSVVGMYIITYHRTDLNLFLIKFDTWGITTVGRAEQQRLQVIRRLDIPIEQRQALSDNTIFIGANKTMVMLAIGEPVKVSQTEESLDRWIYQLGDRTRPIILYFEADELIRAEKGSNLDVINIE
ncbi:MAG: hypothetical protein COV36_01810 [Alphaproteobacteria bacterium CG11_big_fil_rev_8_21_14_0_20_44_7]|nr:MAG: hypothetical protein COV36_01810 [Alphaproteobacteria bacterium CG11_big_fil_rev_8_21_14_0_20_44_7]